MNSFLVSQSRIIHGAQFLYRTYTAGEKSEYFKIFQALNLWHSFYFYLFSGLMKVFQCSLFKVNYILVYLFSVIKVAAMTFVGQELIYFNVQDFNGGILKN